MEPGCVSDFVTDKAHLMPGGTGKLAQHNNAEDNSGW